MLDKLPIRNLKKRKHIKQIIDCKSSLEDGVISEELSVIWTFHCHVIDSFQNVFINLEFVLTVLFESDTISSSGTFVHNYSYIL